VACFQAPARAVYFVSNRNRLNTWCSRAYTVHLLVSVSMMPEESRRFLGICGSETKITRNHESLKTSSNRRFSKRFHEIWRVWKIELAWNSFCDDFRVIWGLIWLRKLQMIVFLRVKISNSIPQNLMVSMVFFGLSLTSFRVARAEVGNH